MPDDTFGIECANAKRDGAGILGNCTKAARLPCPGCHLVKVEILKNTHPPGADKCRSTVAAHVN